MRPDLQLDQALQAPKALEELLRVTHGLAAEGRSQGEVYELCEALLARVREQLGPNHEEAVLMLMDVVCGWCLPTERIWPGELPRRHAPEAGSAEV